MVKGLLSAMFAAVRLVVVGVVAVAALAIMDPSQLVSAAAAALQPSPTPHL